MNILVASVLAPGERTPVWYALQRQFLHRTTEAPFTHGVYLNGVDPVRFEGAAVLGRSRTNDGPAIALARVAEYFRANRDKHTHFLVLAPDAWPVCPSWHAVLGGLLGRHDRKLAAPVKYENLEPFAHPAAVFCTAAALDRLEFAVAPYTNVYGRPARALQLTAPPRDVVLPLLRSNRVSPHPVYGGVYGHLFYHHGTGGMPATTRPAMHHSFDHYIPAERHAQIEARLYQELLRDPVRLMARLTGTTEAAPC